MGQEVARRRLQLARAENALATVEPRKLMEVGLLLLLLLRRRLIRYIELLLLVRLQEELPAVALAQLQWLARRLGAAGVGGGRVGGGLAPLVVRGRRAGDGGDAFAVTLQMSSNLN